MIRSLKKRIRHFLLSNDFTTDFYSQGGEDAILHGIFLKKLNSGKKGFFVDVGAFHPFLHSNTYRLYLNGWRGINIDANPGSMKLFTKHRPQDMNLEFGIGNNNESATFYILGVKSTMNSFSKDHFKIHGMAEATAKEIPLQMRSLESVLDEYSHSFEEIDLLNIDAEGWDFEVLRSNNWKKYRPGVVVVEITCQGLEDVKQSETARLLLNQNYRIVAKNVLKKNLASVFFVDENYDY